MARELTETVAAALRPQDRKIVELAAEQRDETISTFLRSCVLDEARSVVLGEDGEGEGGEDE